MEILIYWYIVIKIYDTVNWKIYFICNKSLNEDINVKNGDGNGKVGVAEKG